MDAAGFIELTFDFLAKNKRPERKLKIAALFVDRFQSKKWLDEVAPDVFQVHLQAISISDFTQH